MTYITYDLYGNTTAYNILLLYPRKTTIQSFRGKIVKTMAKVMNDDSDDTQLTDVFIHKYVLEPQVGV